MNTKNIFSNIYQNLYAPFHKKKLHLINNAIKISYSNWKIKLNIFNKFFWDMLGVFSQNIKNNKYIG